jgi:hypothetical protein
MDSATVFLDDLASRLADRVQLTSDSHNVYARAVEAAFGANVDYGQIIKIFGQPPGTVKGQQYAPPICIGMRKSSIEGRPDPKHISTSYAERNNLNIRMHSRRLTRLTNAFSKKVANHRHAMALHFLYYNFVRQHQTLRMSPAMAAGITKRLWEMSDVIDMLEAWEATNQRSHEVM